MDRGRTWGEEVGRRERSYTCRYIFFKQETAYKISAGLVGSERCIGDRFGAARLGAARIGPERSEAERSGVEQSGAARRGDGSARSGTVRGGREPVSYIHLTPPTIRPPRTARGDASSLIKSPTRSVLSPSLPLTPASALPTHSIL